MKFVKKFNKISFGSLTRTVYDFLTPSLGTGISIYNIKIKLKLMQFPIILIEFEDQFVWHYLIYYCLVY